MTSKNEPSIGGGPLNAASASASDEHYALAGTLTPNHDHAPHWLAWWHRAGPWYLYWIATEGGAPNGARFDAGDAAGVHRWLAEHAAHNIYFGVNGLTPGYPPKKPAKADVAELVGFHVDVDPRAGHDLAAERTRILALLQSPSEAPPPSCIIDTGGGFSAYWRLAAPVAIDSDEVLIWAESVNKGLIALFGGDRNTFNLDRIMRVPGPINWPNEAKKKKGRMPALARVVERHDDRVYVSGDFDRVPTHAATSPAPSPAPRYTAPAQVDGGEAEKRCMAYVAKCPDSVQGDEGSNPMLRVCCECFRFALDDEAAWRVATSYGANKATPPWTKPEEIEHKLKDAKVKVLAAGEWGIHLRQDRTPPARDGARRGVNNGAAACAGPPLVEVPEDEEDPIGVADLIRRHPNKHPAIIDNLLRAGEVMNLVSAPKIGKTWMGMGLMTAVSVGQHWLGFPTTAGRVLLLDGELHPGEIAFRLAHVCEATGIEARSINAVAKVKSLRGRRWNVNTIEKYLHRFPRGTFTLIIVDALYRFMPGGLKENDNESMMQVYNVLDAIAEDQGCAIVVVHHSSKGDQSEKAVTDVGSGAGSIARAADTHLVMRHHEDENVVVVEARTRSFKQPVPYCIRWTNPGWELALNLDPTKLRSSGRRKPKDKADEQVKPVEPWTPERFAWTVVGDGLLLKDQIFAAAKQNHQMPTSGPNGADALLKRAEADGLVFRHKGDGTVAHRFSTTPPESLHPNPGAGGRGGGARGTPPQSVNSGGCGGDSLPPSPPPPGPSHTKRIAPGRAAEGGELLSDGASSGAGRNAEGTYTDAPRGWLDTPAKNTVADTPNSPGRNAEGGAADAERRAQ